MLGVIVFVQPGTLGDNGEEEVCDATPQSIDRGPNPEACRYMNERLVSPEGQDEGTVSW